MTLTRLLRVARHRLRSLLRQHITWIHDLRRDLLYGLRILGKHRAFTSVAVASLAIGIGANAAVLGVIERVLFEPLPMPDADRLVIVRTMPLDNRGQPQLASLPDYLAWRERSRAFTAVGAAIGDRRDLAAGRDRRSQSRR